MLAGHAERIWQVVATALPDFTVEVVAQVDSTNSELMRRARDGQTAPVLLVAQRQTAGRGRLGRQWSSDASSLTCSLGLLLAPASWSGLSLAVGLAIAQALHDRVRLKWPNDLWVDDRKLAGILIETAATDPGDAAAARYAVIGLGMNIAQPQPQPQETGFSTPAAALRELWPQASAGAALERIAAPLVAAVHAFAAQGFAPVRERYLERDLLLGRPVVLSDGQTGVAAGVDGEGALLVRTAAGMRSIHSAEVSVRPAAAPGRG